MKRIKEYSLTLGITGFLLILTGVSFSLFTYRETGSNQKLIMGDIWIRYNENTSTINIPNMIPLDIKENINRYLNPIMEEQSMSDNALYECINKFSEYSDMNYDSGTTVETYCRGEGRADGETLSEYFSRWQNEAQTGGYDFLSNGGQEYLDKGIIVLSGDSYILNPEMANQSTSINELYFCTNFIKKQFNCTDFEATDYCQGKPYYGHTFQGDIDNKLLPENIYSVLLQNNIVIQEIKDMSYFEFTISGKNTYSEKDIYYDIILNHGSNSTTKNTRIDDKYLKFALYKVEDDSEIELFFDKSFNDLNNKRVYVHEIPKNTKTEINDIYRLYMWISDEVRVGNVDQSYTMEEWEDLYASIRVDVTGDLFEKEVLYEDMYAVTDDSCFEYQPIAYYSYNYERDEESILACANYLNTIWGLEEERMDDGETYEEYCQGTGTRYGYTIHDDIDISYFMNSEFEYLSEINLLKKDSGLMITNYDSSCGSDVVIPKMINNQYVIGLGMGSFSNKNLTSVVIPNTLLKIPEASFRNNYIINVVFESNSKLKHIGHEAFYGQNQGIVSVNIPYSVDSLACSAFNYGVTVNAKPELACYKMSN